MASILARSKKGGMEKGHEMRATEQTKRLIQQDKDAPLGNPGLAHLDRSHRTLTLTLTPTPTLTPTLTLTLAGGAWGLRLRYALRGLLHPATRRAG